MKILQFAPYIPPFPGGQERYVMSLSKALARKGHYVEIITTTKFQIEDIDNDNNINIRTFNPWATILRNPIAPGMIMSISSIKDFDIVHCHNEHSFPSMIAAFGRLLNRTPLMLTVHGQLIFGNSLQDSIVTGYERTIGRTVIQVSDSIAVLSNNDKDFISKIAPRSRSRIFLSSNAIDVDELKKNEENHVVCEPIADLISKKKSILLFVGQLVKRKGIQWLIEAYSYLPNDIKERMQLVIVGDGPDKEEFIDLGKHFDSRISFLGYVDERQMPYVYGHARIFCLPSLSEGCPGTVLEAMYYGIPVIATDIPGVRDHFRDVSILVPPGDVTSLRDAISQLFKDHDLSSRLSERGVNHVMNGYTWDEVADRYIQEYQRIIRER